MGGNTKRIERVDVFGEPVANTFAFALEGAKESIPDNEDAPVVFVQVFLLHAVMNTVV